MNKIASCRCKNSPNVFYYIYGEYMLTPNRKPVTNFVKEAYHVYFGMKLGEQGKVWAPHMVCKSCTEYLRQWTMGTKNSMKFGIPMASREQSDHATDCYFCAIDLTGIKKNNRAVSNTWILTLDRYLT